MTYPTILPFSAAVLEEVSHERGAQENKWGQQNHPDGVGDDRRLLHDISRPTYGTLCYLARNLTDASAKAGNLTYADIFVEEVFEALSALSPQELRGELIQVAAVATAWVEAIDRRSQR